MSLDVHAYIVVGLPVSRLDITKMPHYTKEIDRDWRELVDSYYDVDEMHEFKYREVHELCDDENRIFGILVAKTKSWEANKISFSDLASSVSKARGKFKKLIGKEPSVYLMPHTW